MIKAFFDLEDEHSIYWAPAVLVDIILHFFLFGQMAIDYYTWYETKVTWRKELMFKEMYNDANNQQDEAKIREAVDDKWNRMAEGAQEELLNKPAESVKTSVQ